MRTPGTSRTFFAVACLCVLGVVAFAGSSASSVGAAETFPGQGFLPHDRAWEMVSPAEKNGGNVARTTFHSQAAADGNAVIFTSTVGLADVRGTNTFAQYMARRDGAPGTNGWSSHAITPLQSPNLVIANSLTQIGEYRGDFSPDLSQGVFKAIRPLSEDASAAGAINLYLRSDLTAPGPGSYRLLTDSLAPSSSLPPFFMLWVGAPHFAGASTDFSHVFFQSPLGLTEEGPSAPQLGPMKLYENFEGTVRVVGRVPIEPATSCDDTGGPAVECVEAETSQAGIEAGRPANIASQYSARMISADGSRVFFQTPAPEHRGKIYLREDGVRTFQLNASEKTTPESPAPAELWDASRDGSRAFFTTYEGLVDGDDNTGNDLYMYEVEKPVGERLTLLSDPEDGGFEVIGASDDGRYVYFYGSYPQGLNLWHDGELSDLGGEDQLHPGTDQHAESSAISYRSPKPRA